MLFVRDFLTDQTVRRAAGAPAEPKISIILPTYRRRDSLKTAIESVLAQSFGDFELLVMDDGSTDGSADLIRGFQAADPRVIHVRHERNCGLPAMRVNEGIELARGGFLAFQFDDDRWRPIALDALWSASQRQPEPSIIVGKALYRAKSGEATLPAVDLNVVSLYDQNRLANNSVLIPRQLFDQFGMYDCHIGMRRLCDWDLWLRYVKYVPFIVVDETISDVFEGNEGSIGRTVPWDPALFRYLNDIPRDALLTPGRWRDYEVDALRIGEVRMNDEIARRLYEEQLVPYYLRFRNYFPEIEGFSATIPNHPRTALLAKASYDVSVDIALNHFDALANRRGSCKAHFSPLAQIQPNWVAENDAILLMRTVEEPAKALAQQALDHGKSLGFHLDDDLLNFHEFGPEFSYIAPGTPYHNTLSELIGAADAVWTTSEHIESTIQPLNPRTVPHNGSMPEVWLPSEIRSRKDGQPLRIGYVGTGYRIEEFKQIWEGFQRLSKEFGDKLVFEFWGLDPNALPALDSPTKYRPFTFSYFHYLKRLKNAQFDILVTPLLDHPRPRLGKAQIKYYETAVAGAFGIFSDVPPYAKLPGGLTCLKPENTADAWHAALRQAVAMPSAEFDLMRRRLLAHVREDFTPQAQIHLHEAAWEATEFHARTRKARWADGRPRVMFVLHSANFGGGELQLWRRLRLARKYGIEPIVVLPKVLQGMTDAEALRREMVRENVQLEFVEYCCLTEPRSPEESFNESERNQIRELLLRCRPALVHTVTFIPSFGQICTEMNIPHATSVYAVDDDFNWPSNHRAFKHCDVVQSDSIRYAVRWRDLLGCAHRSAREVVPDAVLELGRDRFLSRLDPSAPREIACPRMVVSGTLQERKRQFETLQAAVRLAKEGHRFELDFYGYTHFYPKYLQKCEDVIAKNGLNDRIRFKGFCKEVLEIHRSADIILSLSTYESFPSSIKEAMSAGTLVVATPVGGIAELIIDGVTGILCANTSVEAITVGIRRALTLDPEARIAMIDQARRVARSEFHPQRAANDLLGMYNCALERAGAASAESSSVSRPDVPSRSDVAASTPSRTSFNGNRWVSRAKRLPQLGKRATKKGVRLAMQLYRTILPPQPYAQATESVAPIAKEASTQAEASAEPRDEVFAPSPEIVPGTVRLRRELQYRLVPGGCRWNGVDVRLWVQRRARFGQMILRIRTEEGRVLRESRADLSAVRDDTWLSFRFDALVNSENLPVEIGISLHEADPDTQINIVENNRLESKIRRGLRKARLLSRGNSLQCRLRYAE